MSLFQQYSNVEPILEPKSLISVMNLTDLAIKRIIRMTKKINSFTTMCQADQIALLKGGCTELMILRSVFNYDPDKNSWRVSTTMYNFQDSTDTLKFWTEKRAINKKNFVFHLFLMKLGEVVITHVYYTSSTKLHQNRMKKKNFFY